MTTTPSIYKSPEGEQAVMALYDAVLADWPVPFQSRTIATRHGNTFVIAAGEQAAPPLILLHGAGSNSAIWRADFPAYSHEHRVFAVDLPGEPGKIAPNRPPWEGPAFAEWLEDVLDGLQLPQATLLGISQGAWTALRFATLHPARVNRLVLLCPGGVAPDRLSFLLRAIPLSLAGEWGTRRIIRLLAGDAPMTPEAEQFMALILKHFRSRVGVLPIFTDEELARLTMPALLIMGGRDALRVASKISARLRQLLPQCSVVIQPEAGHVLLDTQAQVLPFLAPAADRAQS